MKHNDLVSFLTTLFFSLILFAACAGQPQKIIFRPPDTPANPPPSGLFDSWEIIKSQNGQGADGIPEWVRWYFDNAVNEIESLDRFSGKYIFIGENGGNNFSALQHWANGFTVEQDLPRLVTRRVERRLITSASLYPDDEYGEYFEFLIREMSNGEFLNAVKEETFWLKRKIPVSDTENDASNDSVAVSNSDAVRERYEFLVLVSVDKETLQNQIKGIIKKKKTKMSPTKDQDAAIARIKNNFFEGF
jgi:hypothetical protein